MAIFKAQRHLTPEVIHLPVAGSDDPVLTMPADLGLPAINVETPKAALFVVVKVSPKPPRRLPGKALKMR